MTSPDLPPGYALVAELRRKGTVRVVRASRGSESLVLRLEHGETGEGTAELGVLGAVRHPGIAALVDHGSLPGGGRFVARRWIEGEDLRTWSEAGADPADVGRLVARLAPALDHLHRQGFVHADLKAENVIVSLDRRPVLCDFGLARRLGAERLAEGASGTLFHLSPEEILGHELTPRSDLFALGAMLHRLLARPERSARDFYALFPRRSFLDAAGTDPEDLPPWSRDLIAALTARDPARRPSTAGRVGRQLAERLGIELDLDALDEDLSWPVGLGRESWLAHWLEGPESPETLGRWLRTPAGEDPRPFWEHLRLIAGLAGRPVQGLDLPAELERLRSGVALDAWAEEHARGTAWIVALVSEAEARSTLALDRLALACRQLRRRDPARGPRLSVVGPFAPTEGDWQAADVPPVERATIRAFLEARLPEEDPGRRAAFAERLDDAGAGSASALDRLLERCRRGGLLLSGDGGFQLRPGAVPPLEPPDATTDLETDFLALEERERRLLCALLVCGERARAEEVGALADIEGDGFGASILALQRAGWIRLHRGGGPLEVALRRSLPPCPEVSSTIRALHAARAGLPGVDSLRALASRFCAEPDRARVVELAGELAELSERGRGETVLDLCEELRRSARLLGLDLSVRAPEILVEESRAWCAIGQADHALRVARGIEGGDDPRLAALAELVFARVAALRHETEAALSHYEHAADLAPEVRLEAEIGRIELQHALGRDEEVVAAVQQLDPRSRERSGELRTRRRAQLEYLAAMSSFRLGRVESARETLIGLRDEAHANGDVALEAILRLNLATIERRTGSLDRARTELEASIDLYRRAGLIAGLAHARATMGGLLRELGLLIEAEPLLTSAAEIRERLGDPDGAGTARGMLGLLLFERGHARAAIETLESTAGAMRGAQQHRFAPLLLAVADEMRARIGEATKARAEEAADADPRILTSRARAAWIRGDDDDAAALAERAEGLAASLKQSRLVQEARGLAARIARSGAVHTDTAGTTERVLAVLARIGERFDETQAVELAEELERNGRDDRAARLWFALAARAVDPSSASRYAERATDSFDRCAAGLTSDEASALRRHLLGEPDPWLGDFTGRSASPENEEFEMEVIALLDINRRLVRQKNLDSLLRVIVEHALEVTGAERGFLVLEEHGELRFDRALDSCRGDIAQPELEVSGSVVRRALEDMKPILVSNAVDDPLLGHRTSVVSLELRSILCVPFEIGENLRGAVYVDHRLRRGAFDSRAEKLCTLLADQAALAIQQIKRLEEIRSLNRELEQRVVDREARLRSARAALMHAGRPAPGSGLLGRSAAMREVVELLGKAAPSDLAVLIVGQSGTGKEVAARTVHALSSRREGPFVSESCAAIPASLIESELFGYRKGAFTGADRDRAGLIEQAHGGTLFLDEIGEIPSDLQAKLLRVLETNEVRRIGDDAPRKVDFRLVVATNRDLEREITDGRFRQDLFYRLNGIRVVMPPLAARTEDIPLLVDHFLEQETSLGQPKRRVSKAVLAALARRSWPGNVRELKNEVARLCVLSDGDLDDPSLVSVPASLPEADQDGGVLPLAELERRAIHHALEQTGGDKRKAAKLLGISRAKIYQRLKEWENRGLAR